MKQQETYRFILSGGGTGGHIYPAVAIADELKLRYPNAEFLFVGASNRMEMEKVPQAGYAIKGLWISGIQRRLSFKNLIFPIKLLYSIIKAFGIIRDFKPNVVIGTGGFASGPLLYAATIKKIPSLIQEQNSFPGITNKLLAKRVKTICVAYQGLERYFNNQNIKLTGNPIRTSLLSVAAIDKEEALASLGLSGAKHTLLVLGGSLGAKRINEFVAQHLDYFKVNNIQLIWQCGKLYYEEYKQYNAIDNVHVHAFLNDMSKAYASADTIISRAGAISVSELCVVGKPVVFIPSPNVAEDHQTKNAKAIADKQAAILIAEKDINSLFKQQFNALLADSDRQKLLGKNIKALALEQATKTIVNHVEALLHA